MSRVMMSIGIALCAGVLLTMPAAPASALDPKVKDHDAARQAARSGQIRSLGEIKRRVGSRVRGELIGSKLNLDSKRYRLRYLRDGSVVEVDVDARTGNILNIQGD